MKNINIKRLPILLAAFFLVSTAAALSPSLTHEAQAKSAKAKGQKNAKKDKTTPKTKTDKRAKAEKTKAEKATKDKKTKKVKAEKVRGDKSKGSKEAKRSGKTKTPRVKKEKKEKSSRAKGRTKVNICKIPGPNISKARVISIAEPALKAHLRRGACRTNAKPGSACTCGGDIGPEPRDDAEEDDEEGKVIPQELHSR